MDDLRRRVLAAVRQCYTDTQVVPTASLYRDWRETLPDDQRNAQPSVSSVVPLAYPSWGVVRLEAGVPARGASMNPRGPRRRWTPAECIDAVRQYMESGESSSLRGYESWVYEQRELDNEMPSPSTVRIRTSLRWNDIIELARLRTEAQAS